MNGEELDRFLTPEVRKHAEEFLGSPCEKCGEAVRDCACEVFDPFKRGPVEVSAEDAEKLSKPPEPLKILVPVEINEEDEDPEELRRKFDEALAAGEKVCITAPPYEREFKDLIHSGLLWAINRYLLHPRGFALAVHKDGDGNAVGWSLRGDGREPWKYLTDAVEDECFTRFERTLTDQMFRAALDAAEATLAREDAADAAAVDQALADRAAGAEPIALEDLAEELDL